MGGIYSIAGAIVTLAIIGVLFTNGNTARIIDAVTSGFANALKAAKP